MSEDQQSSLHPQPNTVNLQYWPTTRDLRAKVIDAAGAEVANFTVSNGSPESFDLQEGQELRLSLLPQAETAEDAGSTGHAGGGHDVDDTAGQTSGAAEGSTEAASTSTEGAAAETAAAQ